MVAIPTLEEEDAKRPSRERESLVGERTRIINSVKAGLLRLGIRDFNPALRRAPKQLETLVSPEGAPLPPNTLDEIRRDPARLAVVREQIDAIGRDRQARLEQAPQSRSNAMVLLLARIVGVGLETADMLVQEILSRPLRDRRAVARYAGLTGSPDESGARRREKGLSKSGNARVRRGLIQLAWRFLMFQKGSALARWYRSRTEAVVPAQRKDDDRRPHSEAAHRLLAAGDHRLSARRRDPAGRLRETRNSTDRELQRRSRMQTSPITIRGGGDTRNAVASTPREECTRRLGASYSKRMAASWSRSPADLTEYMVAVRSVAPHYELPSDQDLKLRSLPAAIAQAGRRHDLRSPQPEHRPRHGVSVAPTPTTEFDRLRTCSFSAAESRRPHARCRLWRRHPLSGRAWSACCRRGPEPLHSDLSRCRRAVLSPSRPP